VSAAAAAGLPSEKGAAASMNEVNPSESASSTIPLGGDNRCAEKNAKDSKAAVARSPLKSIGISVFH
jgi:hypothetical protein